MHVLYSKLKTHEDLLKPKPTKIQAKSHHLSNKQSTKASCNSFWKYPSFPKLQVVSIILILFVIWLTLQQPNKITNHHFYSLNTVFRCSVNIIWLPGRRSVWPHNRSGHCWRTWWAFWLGRFRPPRVEQLRRDDDFLWLTSDSDHNSMDGMITWK